MIQPCFHNSWLPLPIFIYSAPRPDPSLQALCMLSLQTWTYIDRHVPPETTTNILATKKTKYIPTCTEGTGSWLLKGKSVGEECGRSWREGARMVSLHRGVSGDPTGRRGSSLILLLAATENSSSQEYPIKEQHVRLHETLFPKKQFN